MSATRTPGITVGADGRFFIDKRHRGIRIGMRVGSTNQEQAEQRLRTEMQQTATSAVTLGWMQCRRSSPCRPSVLDRPIRSRGKNRIACFPGCRRT